MFYRILLLRYETRVNSYFCALGERKPRASPSWDKLQAGNSPYCRHLLFMIFQFSYHGLEPTTIILANVYVCQCGYKYGGNPAKFLWHNMPEHVPSQLLKRRSNWFGRAGSTMHYIRISKIDRSFPNDRYWDMCVVFGCMRVVWYAWFVL